MGIFGLIRDMQQDDEIGTITRRIRGVEERLDKLEALVRALNEKLDRVTGEGRRGSGTATRSAAADTSGGLAIP
ncbi:MAG: hypothetical protein OXL34_12765 [Gemmatimonadota bacterium]|nr:hypothetical protein [Gemmatimonadota bacterium]